MIGIGDCMYTQDILWLSVCCVPELLVCALECVGTPARHPRLLDAAKPARVELRAQLSRPGPTSQPVHL